MTMPERRRFIRLPARLNATYQILNAGPSQVALTRNTSGGGIGFFTEKLLPAGTVVRLEVKFPERQRSVTFTAEITWSGKLLLAHHDEQPRAFEAGARFLDIAPEDQAFILQYSSAAAPPSPST